MKKFQIQNTQNRFLQILSRWVILNQNKTNYDVNLTATIAKIPTFFSNIFFTKIVTLDHTFPGPFVQ